GSRCGAGTVTLGATASAGTINWYSASTGSTSLGTGTSFTTPSITATTPYYVDATNNGCTTSARTSVNAAISTGPTATISGDKTICSGASATISIALTGTANWTVAYAIGSANSTTVTATSSPYTFTTSTSGVYTVTFVTDNTGCSGTHSGSATIKVNTAITLSNKTEVCNSANTKYVVEFDIAGGDTASYAVTVGTGSKTTPTHFKSDSIASGTSYTFTVNDKYACAPASVTGNRTCISGCNATATISGSKTICSGTSATISIALAGTPNWSITYAIGGVSQPSVTATSSPYTFTTSTAGAYTLVSVSDGNSCNATINGSAAITINTAITTSNKTETCNGSSYVVAFDISGGDQASYAVAGGTITNGNHFTSSNSIASGTSYTFTVSDKYACAPASVTGNKTCSSGCNATATISGSKTICSGTSATISIALTGTPNWSITYAIGGVSQPSVTATASPFTFTTSTAGTYTLVSVSDGNSCNATNSGSATITVNALPTVTTIASPSSAAVCIGGSVTLSGAGATTYSWSGGVTNGTSFTPASTLTYTVTGTDANNCSNTASRVVSVFLLPTVGATESPSATVCSGVSVTLSGTGATNYSWSGGITNGASFTPASTTTYTVTGTDANSCSNTATQLITVKTCSTVATPTITAQGTTLVSSATTGNQWYLNGVAISGATSQTVTPTQ